MQQNKINVWVPRRGWCTFKPPAKCGQVLRAIRGDLLQDELLKDKDNDIVFRDTELGTLETGHKYTLVFSEGPVIDTSLQYLEAVMGRWEESEPPPQLQILPTDLPALNRPLPMLITTCLELTVERETAPVRVDQLATSVASEPAERLASVVSQGFDSAVFFGRGEDGVHLVCSGLVLRLMMRVLELLNVDYDIGRNVADPSGATDGIKRPDALLFLRNVLMFKGEEKEKPEQFEVACMELCDKMATWSALVHGARQYLLCYAAAGHRLRFFAVNCGGATIQPVSREFDMTKKLDRLMVMHTTIRVLTIILQQLRHDVPEFPLPLYKVEKRPKSTITYRGDKIEKKVEAQHIPDEQVWLQLYEWLLGLPKHGMIRPLGMPVLCRGVWQIQLPLCSRLMPRTLDELRRLVRDVLTGLQQLHHAGFVHRDVRKENIMKVPASGAYALIDFELAGEAGTVPLFQCPHWPLEASERGAAYTTAADVHGVGKVMGELSSSVRGLDERARDLQLRLLAEDPSVRPSAAAALCHSWLAAGH